MYWYQFLKWFQQMVCFKFILERWLRAAQSSDHTHTQKSIACWNQNCFFFLILIPSKNGQLPLEDTVLNLTCLRPSCQYRIFFTQSQARKPCVQSLDIWHLFIRNSFGLIDNHRHCKKPLSGCYKNCPYISPICVSSSSLTENFCGFSLSRSNGA